MVLVLSESQLSLLRPGGGDLRLEGSIKFANAAAQNEGRNQRNYANYHTSETHPLALIGCHECDPIGL